MDDTLREVLNKNKNNNAAKTAPPGGKVYLETGLLFLVSEYSDNKVHRHSVYYYEYFVRN